MPGRVLLGLPLAQEGGFCYSIARRAMIVSSIVVTIERESFPFFGVRTKDRYTHTESRIRAVALLFIPEGMDSQPKRVRIDCV